MTHPMTMKELAERDRSQAFTPGPWRIDGLHQLDGWGHREGEDQCELACLPHPTFDALEIFGRRVRDDFAEHEANARLIAAAPELYEALEPFAKLGRMLDGPFAPALFKDADAVGFGGAWSENGEPRTVTFGDLRRAAAALAKARASQETTR
jgi:hypothetical protein